MANETEILEVVLQLKDNLSKMMKTTERNVGKSADNMSKKMQGVGKSMQAAGRTMTLGLTLPIVGLGAAIVKSSATFEKSMSRVGALSGATSIEFDAMRLSAKKLGAETAFSASQAAEGMSFLAMAGFETQQIIDAMPGSLALASAGQIDLATTADIASNIMTGFGLEATEMGRAADVLAQTFTSSNVDLVMLGESMKFVGPVASAAGLQFEEMAAAVGLMGNAGIQGTLSGNALKRAISNLLAPTDSAASLMDELGIQAIDAEGKMNSLSTILAQLEVGFEGVGQAETAAKMMQLFGQRAGPGMIALLKAGSKALDEFTNENLASAGRAAEIQAKQLDNLAGQWTLFTSKLESAAIAIGDAGLVPMLRELIIVLEPLPLLITNANPELLKMGTIFAAVLAALGPLTVGLGSLIRAAGLIGGVFAGMSLPVVAAVAAVVGAGALIIANWDSISAKANQIFPDAAIQVEAFSMAIKDLFGIPQKELPALGMGDLRQMEADAAKRQELIAGASAGGMGGLRVLESMAPQLELEQQAGKLATFANKFRTMLQPLADFAQEVWSKIQLAFFTVLNWVKDEGMQLIQPAIDWWNENLPEIQKTVEIVLTAIQDFWNTWGDEIMVAFKIFWSGIKGILTLAWDAIKAVVEVAIEAVGTVLKVAMKLIQGDFHGAWRALVDGVLAIAETLSEFLMLSLGKLILWVEDNFGDMVGFIVGVFENLNRDALKVWDTMLGAIKTSFTSWWNDLKSDFTGMWTFIAGGWRDHSTDMVGESVIPDMNAAILLNFQETSAAIMTDQKELWRDVAGEVRDGGALVLSETDQLTAKLFGHWSTLDNNLRALNLFPSAGTVLPGTIPEAGSTGNIFGLPFIPQGDDSNVPGFNDRSNNLGFESDFVALMKNSPFFEDGMALREDNGDFTFAAAQGLHDAGIDILKLFDEGRFGDVLSRSSLTNVIEGAGG